MSDYSKICIPKMLVEFNGCKGTQLNNIALYNGTIFINGRAIDTAYENDAYYWHRRTRCYDGEKGILKLSNNGLLGQGIIEYNNVKYSFITFGENQYLMSYINPEGLEKSFEFNMGIRKDDNGNLFTYGKVITGDSEMDELINSFNPVTFQVLNNKLHANININSVICSYGILEFIDAQFDFNLTYEDAIGKITMYDNTKSDYLGLQCDLSGQCIHPNLSTIKEKHTLFMSVKGRSLNKGLLKEKLPNLLPLKKDLSLSVNELYSLEAPNGYEIQERAMTTLFNLMLYSIDDTLRGYFGQAKPIIGIDLTQADVDLLKDDEIKIFLTNFAKAYLCKAYTGSGDEKVKTAIYKAANLDSKMKYFWEGNGKTSLASNDGYNLAASDIFQRTYGILTPGLVKYYDNNPKEWAEKLYNYCTTDTVLASIAIQELSDGTSRINHLSSILHFLYPDSLVKLEITNETVPYSVALFYKVLDYKLNNAITENSTNNIDNYDEFQKEFFSQYISQIFDEDGTLFDDREKKEAVEDINKYMELNKISTREELILEMSALASQFALFALKVIKPTTQSINEFFQINTTSSMYVRLGIGMFVYITGIGACVQCLIDWENLNLEDKIIAIAVTVQNIIGVFRSIAIIPIIKVITNANSEFQQLIRATNEIRQRGVGLYTSELATEATGLKNALEFTTLTTNKWVKFANFTFKVANIMNIIVIGLIVAYTGYSIYKDFTLHEPIGIKVLDILQEVVLVVSGISLFLSFAKFFRTVSPWVMGVILIAGVTLSIVSLFIKRKDPPSPVESFISTILVPFVASLEMPSEQWLDEREVIDKNINPDLLELAMAI